MARQFIASTNPALIRGLFFSLLIFLTTTGYAHPGTSAGIGYSLIITLWYNTWWAYILYAVMGLLLINLYVKRRTRELEAKHRELKKAIKEKTDQLSARVEELALINNVQEGLVSKMDMQSIYDLVGNKIRDAFDAQVVIIGSFDNKTGLEHFNYTIENGKHYYPDPRLFDKLRKQLIETKQKIVINDIKEALKWFGNKSIKDTKPIKSAVFVPMMIEDQVKRYVSLQNIDKENAFSDSDVRLLETLANSMSVALENARLFDETTRLLNETEQHSAELGVINSVQGGLAKELDMQGIYNLVGDRIQKLFNTQIAIIAAFDHVNQLEKFNYHFEKGETSNPEPRHFDKVRKHLIETGQNILINEDVPKAIAEFGMRVVPGTEMPKSMLFMPLKTGDKVNGYVSLQNIDNENAFSVSDVRLLETLSNSMSIALENARLFAETTRLLKETEQRTSELAVINSVQEGLVAQLDIQSIYDLVGEKIRNIFSAQIIDIVTYDRKKNLIEDRYAFEKGDRTLLGVREPLGFRKHVIDTHQVFIINEDMDGKSKEYDSYVTIGEQPKSAVFVPMITGGEVTGVISLQNLDHEFAFSDSAVNLLITLANSMSVALKSAGLFDETNRLLKETEQRNAELAVINSVQESLVAKLDMAGIYELVGEKIRQIFGAQVIDIVTYDPVKNVIADQYAYEKGDRTLLGEREVKGFRKHVIKTGTLLLHNENVLRAMREFDNEVLIGDAPKSQIYVPMIADGKVKGIISLQNLDHEHAFSKSDVSLLTTLANSMSVALESARLFDETNRLLKETEQRTSELAVINSVQEGLVAQMDIQSIYDLVGEKIRNIFNAQIIDIVTYDKKKNLIEDRYSYEKGDRALLGARPPLGFRKHLIESPHVFLINEKMGEKSREYDSYVTIGEQPKSAVFVPMMTSGEISGIISLQNLDHEFAFSDSDVNLLTTLANSMTVALQSAGLFDETNRLLKETEQRNAELAVINSVQESLVGGMDMSGIYELVGEKMREIFGAQVIDIVTFDANRNVITDKYSYEKGDRTLVGERKPTGFRKHVILTGALLLHNENVDKAIKEYGNDILIGQIPKSQIYVPMLADGRVKGIISLQNLDHEHAFSESDVSLLTTLTNSMSVALESARLFDETARLLKETEQRNAELAVITTVQESLVAKMDVEAIYNLVGEKMREVFNAQVIDITTYDSATNLIEDRYAYEKGDRTLISKREPYGFRKHVIDTGQILVINKDMYKQKLIYDNSIVVGQGAKSLVMVPLMAGGKVNGVISLQNLDRENAFSDSEISLLSTLVNSMSVALKSARLFDETTHLLKETEQRTAELAVINSVQEGLANELDMSAIYNLVGDRIQKIFNAQAVIIASFDLSNKTEHFNYAYENGEKIKVGTRPINKLREILIGKKHTIHIRSEQEAKVDYKLVAIDETKMPKSLLFVPLLTGNEIKGYVSIQNVDVENAFSDSDVRLLETLANSMSVALENARLFDETNRLLKETEQRTAELAVINSVQEGLVREMNIGAIYELVGKRLCDLFPDTQTLVIRTFDHSTNLEYWRFAIEKGVRLHSEPRDINWANKKLIASQKHLLINNNFLETAKKHGGLKFSIGEAPKSVIFVPMIVGDEVKGSVSLQNVDKENAFTESDLRLLTTLSNSMSVALENARLFDETTRLLADAKQRASELSTVNSISKALASQLNPNELIQFVGDQLHDLFKANIVYLALLNKKTNTINFPYQYGDNMAPFKFGEGLTSKIIITGESLLINQDVSSKVKQYKLEHIGIPAASYLGVPIPVGEEIIGVLSIQSTEQQNRFNENDERLLNTIASSVGVALNNAQLFEDVEQAKMEAEKASKVAEKANEAKSAFLSTVSHELRTPLTSVLGFAKIINKRLNDKIFPVLNQTDPKTEKTVNQINENLQVVISEGERLTHLINDVLDLAKIEAGRMEWNQEKVSLAEVTERAIAATTSLFEQKDIVLVKKIDPNVPDIIGDPDKLIQVVINLFSNAVKFTENGNVICNVSKKENEVIVSITDTGIGIAPEDYGAVFEQFKQVGGDTLTDKPKGTGLGLPICKEIVEHHGGRIWVESTVGKGSVFSFAIPFVVSENKKNDIKEKPIHLNELVKQLKQQMVFTKLNFDGKNATILVVDDDDSIRSLLQQELSEAGYLIEQATNGKQALECIRKNRPDLIILDVMMPEMNGFDVAAILKNDPQTMDIPIIILSIVQDKARGFRIGVDRYLTKPIDTAQLFTEVENLLEQGKSRRKVMVVDEDSEAVRTLADVLQAKGYQVVESDGKEIIKNAVATQPDIIILNSIFSSKQEIVKTLRFEKGLENVLFFIYQ
ncbi:MAG: GAF domain-containing protein [Ginsengibacter sp.]